MMKTTTILMLSLATSTFLFAAPPTSGDIEKHVQVPKEAQQSTNNVIPALPQEILKEPMVHESEKRLEIQHFKLTGALHVKLETLQEIVKPYENQTHTFAQLQKIASLITKAYREQGYFVARAYIPKQEMNEGVLEIAIIEGAYGDFKLTNTSLVDDLSIQAMLDDVKEDAVVSVHTLERAMLLINDTPGAKVTQAHVMPGQKIGTSDFAITTEATNPYNAYVIGDNYGSTYTGRYRFNVGLSANSPLGYGEKFGLNSVLSSTTELKNGKVYYNAPLLPNGLRAELSASKTTYSLAKEYQALDALGNATTLEALLSYPMIRTQQENLNLFVSYAHKKMKDEVRSTTTLTKKESDAISLGMNYTKHCLLFGLPSSTTATLNLRSGNLDSPDNQESDGRYSKIDGTIEKSIQFNPEYTLTTSLRFQKALRDKNLDGSEDFSLGGAYGVRAFPEGEHSAENGYILGAELFYTLPSTQSLNHKVSLFVDTGYATTQNNNGISGSRHLSDIGIGYEAHYQSFFTKAQIARVIGDEKPESEEKDSTRVLLQIGYVY